MSAAVPPDADPALRRAGFEGALPWAAFAAAAILAAAFRIHTGFLNDDSLITLRSAEHLARGDGLVYNVGERVLGVTTPLWALLLAAAVKCGIDGVAAATFFGVLAHGWTAAATVLCLRARGARAAAQVVGGALIVSSAFLAQWAGSGMETPLYTAAVATLLWLFESSRWGALGLVAGAATLLRPDALLVLFPLAVLAAIRERSVRPVLRAAPGFGLFVVPWLVAGALYYGSPFPNSGFAKRLQVEDWGSYLARLSEWAGARGALTAAAFVGAVASVLPLDRGRRAAPAAVLASIVLGMHFGGLPGCAWYFPPAIVVASILAADGMGLAAWSVARTAGAASERRSPAALALLAVPLLSNVNFIRETKDAKIAQSQVERCHGKVGTWLAEHAPEGVSVGVDNIGYIGYRSGLRIVDMMGLVQSGTRERIAAGERDAALRHHRPEMIACWDGRGSTWKYLPPKEWFAEQGYRVVFAAPLYDDRERPAYVVWSRTEPR